MQATKLDFRVLMTNLSLKCYLILSFVGVVRYLVLGFSSSFCRKNNSIHVWGVFLSNSCSSPAGWWLSARVLPGTGYGRVPRAGRGSLGAWPRPCGGKGLASGWGCGHPVERSKVHPDPSALPLSRGSCLLQLRLFARGASLAFLGLLSFW